jgi:hypothetical protein
MRKMSGDQSATPLDRWHSSAIDMSTYIIFARR